MKRIAGTNSSNNYKSEIIDIKFTLASAHLQERGKSTSKQFSRRRQGSNLRGHSPLDFKSNALTTRPRLLVGGEKLKLVETQ